MNIIVRRTPKDPADRAGELASEIMALKHRICMLEREKHLLLQCLAEAVGDDVVVIVEDELPEYPRFVIDENMGGNVLIRRKF
mgnify:CR=1 FL=1